MARLDPHSWADSDQPQADRLVWRARVEFADRVLQCEARLLLHEPAADEGPLDLDTRDLLVQQVTDPDGQPLAFTLGEPDPIVGARLRIALPRGTREVVVRYATSPG